MNTLRKLLYVAVFLFALVLGTLFVVSNPTVTPLNIFLFPLPELQVGLWVVLGFVLGGLCGMLISLGLVLRLRASLMRVNRRLQTAQRADAPQPQTTLEK